MKSILVTVAAAFVVVTVTLGVAWGLTKLMTAATKNAALFTVEHDGHKWVLSNYGAYTPVHHPDCPCGKRP